MHAAGRHTWIGSKISPNCLRMSRVETDAFSTTRCSRSVSEGVESQRLCWHYEKATTRSVRRMTMHTTLTNSKAMQTFGMLIQVVIEESKLVAVCVELVVDSLSRVARQSRQLQERRRRYALKNKSGEASSERMERLGEGFPSGNHS